MLTSKGWGWRIRTLGDEMDDLSIFYNPRCSKCRTAQGLLAERGIEATIVEYLVAPPTVDELRLLMTQLGITDPADMRH